MRRETRTREKRYERKKEGTRESERKVFVRIEAFPVEDQLRDLRCEHVGQFVHVKGVVTKRSGVYPELKDVYYNCIKCEHVMGPFDATIVSTGLRKCHECKSKGPFYVNKERTVYQDYQRLTLQESPSKVRGADPALVMSNGFPLEAQNSPDSRADHTEKTIVVCSVCLPFPLRSTGL